MASMRRSAPPLSHSCRTDGLSASRVEAEMSDSDFGVVWAGTHRHRNGTHSEKHSTDLPTA